MKRCTRCKEEKEEIKFHKRSELKSGLKSECKICVSVSGKQHYAKNRDRIRRRHKLWGENNKENRLIKSKQWYQDNKEKKDAKNREWYKNNKKSRNAKIKEYTQNNRKSLAVYQRKWCEENRRLCRSYSAKHRKVCNTPIAKIYTKENQEKYKNCPEGYEVDHIMPVTGRNNSFTGLHVPWNLQYLTKRDNRIKNNKVA